jgi:class 3 adenylate cyclase/tetratricopeptide (TPR) repeat protein
MTVEERRVVTVLFADLVGYTALAENLDPEQVKRLIESCFERLVADIETFGGRVDKLLGDAIVALFGAPVAHEDDAERAVRAALRMQDTLSRFCADGGQERLAGPDGIRMRVGINTGEVLVGTLIGSDYTAMGDVVNTASRLQAMAPPGGVLIGSATAALCSSGIAREPFGVTAIRGREQVEQSWLVTGAAAAGTRPVRADVPFVGRRSEQTLLDAAVEVVRSGHSGVVSIVGEAGAGKTRLAEQILDALENEAIVVRTACAPYGESNVWAPVTTAVYSTFGIEPDSDAAAVRQAIEKRAHELWGLEQGDPELEWYVDAIGYLMGHPSDLDRLDAAGARDVLTGALTEMMRRSAQTRMTVLWFDNLQWADPMLRDLLAVIVRSLADLPFLLITGQRPDDDIVWPPPVERPLVLRVPLGPLGRDDAATLVRGVLERDHEATEAPWFDDDVASVLVDRGGGNPLFLVELAGLAATCGPRSELPGSLRALIAARLDQLPAPQRAIVDNAAVLGSADSISGLVRFAQAMGQDFRDSDLAELAADGLFDVDGRRWRFRSDVVREVAYQTLTKRIRAQRHAGVAAVLAGEHKDQVDDLAHHSAAAAELIAELGPVDGVPSSIAVKATNALLKAASVAVDAGRFSHAVRHASRALDLHQADPETERQLLLVRASAEMDERMYTDATADVQQVLDGALADGDRVHEAEARRRLGTIWQMQGDLDAARRELDCAVALFRELGEPGRLADGLRARGFAEVFGGSLTDARRFLDEAMEIYHEIADERGHAWTHQSLAWVAFQSGDFADAETQLLEAEERFEAIGDRSGVSWAQGLRAYVSYFLRRFDDAEMLAVAVESEARRWGQPWPALMMQTLLSNLRLWTGRLAEAEQLAERALVGFREMNDRFGIMQALSPLNRARAGLGKKADAKRGVEEAISLGHSFGELSMALQGAAGVAVHVGAGEQALDLSEQVLERHKSTGTTQNEAWVLLALARCQVGDVDGAMAAIESIEIDDFPFGQAGRALVRAMAGDVSGALTDAAAVEEIRGASYFDIALARLAGVLAADRMGDDAESRRWLDLLSSLSSSVGDVVFVSIAQALGDWAQRGSDHEPPTLTPGWRTVIDSAVVG